jgi:hypothetical protein
MARFKAGDRVRILVAIPGLWQEPGTVIGTPDDSGLPPYSRSESDWLYDVALDDGSDSRIRGRDLELWDSTLSAA